MKELEVLTKKAIGFVKESPSCRTCKYMKEFECTMMDRMWYDKCTYNNLCSFNVDKGSSCDKHELIS